MGNHLVGKMFNTGVSAFSFEEIDNFSQEKALQIITDIGNEVVKSTSLDAEFDDYMNPNQKLGRVLMKAYIPEHYEEWKSKEYIDDSMDDIWYYKLYLPFKSKFGFW